MEHCTSLEETWPERIVCEGGVNFQALDGVQECLCDCACPAHVFSARGHVHVCLCIYVNLRASMCVWVCMCVCAHASVDMYIRMPNRRV